MEDPTPRPDPAGRPPHHTPYAGGSENPRAAASGQGADRLTLLAHELGNLLDGSLRTLSLASRSLEAAGHAPDPDDPRKRLEVVRHALLRMAELVDAAMRTPGPKGSPVPSPSAPIELGEAIFHAVDVMAPLAADHGVRIRPVVSNGLSGVPAGTLYPVILNALANAVEAIASLADPGDPPTGCVEINAGWTEDGRIALTVTDDGPGLPDLPLPEICRFGFTRKPTGSGLGLAVAAAIVDDLPAGRMSLRTRTDRDDPARPGARFEVTFRPAGAEAGERR
jgi:signal transduction histidine kinase